MRKGNINKDSPNIKIIPKNINVELSTHLKSKELKCNCKGFCVSTKVSMTLVDKFEELRSLVSAFLKKDTPLKINSGYRCYIHNKNVNGADGSSHVLGGAFDIKLPEGLTIDQFAKFGEDIGFLEIGKYWGRVHFGLYGNMFGKIARWDKRK